jgi:predicted GH43/DUF377 family glycosyl hydrolase
MFRWEKLGKVFGPQDVKDLDWMKEYAQSPSVLIYDDIVRVYFCCRPLPDGKGQYVSRLGYVELNRKNLFDVLRVSREPILSLGEIGTFDEFGTYPASVIRNGKDIRVYYAGWTRSESVPFCAAIGVAVSNDDGQTFERIWSGPVLSYSVDEPFVLGSPKIRRFNGVWYLWYASGRRWIEYEGRWEPVYKIRMAFSNDGLEWTKYGKNILESKLEEDECQASADVFWLKDRYHMLFSYRYNLDFKKTERERGYRIGYAWSDNLTNWIRDDLQVGIGVSEQGWDSETISYPHVFELENNIYMLYQGNQIGKYGFGLARLEDYLCQAPSEMKGLETASRRCGKRRRKFSMGK